MFVKILNGHITTLPAVAQSNYDQQISLDNIKEDSTTDTMSTETTDGGTSNSSESTALRRSMRQQKKKRPDFPRIIIKPIPPPKEGMN